MGWFDKLVGRGDAHIELVKKPIVDSFVPKVEPRDGVHHEYFVDDVAVNGLLAWHCRVYAKDSAPHEMSGSAQSREDAAGEAQAWAAAKKRELRGIA